MSEKSIVLANEWQTMQEQASMFVKSGLLPRAVDTPAKAIVIMMLGRELGIGPMQALAGINVIQGKPTISPQLMLALINRSGYLDDMQVVDDGSCSVTMKRSGRSAHTETFSMADASAMGLLGKDNWKKQPAVMRKWRAISACARVVFPDIIAGMYTSEEINPNVVVDAETGEIIAVEMEQAKDVAVETPTIQAIVDSGLTSVDDIERIEAGGPADEQHWTVSQNWKTFYVYCTKNLGLTRDEVHEALEVDSAKKFTGTKEEAFNALKAYAASKAEAASTATDTETEETHDGQIDLEEFFASDDAPDSGKNAVDAISR